MADTTIREQALAAFDSIAENTTAIQKAIALGGEAIDADTPLADFAPKIINIVNKATPAENEAALHVTINPEGSGGYTPTDATILADLLNGARIAIAVDGIEKALTASVGGLYDYVVAAKIPLTEATKATVHLYLGNASTPVTANPIAVTLKPGSTTITQMVTQLDTSERVEIGRWQRVGDTSGASYFIKRVLSGGTQKTYVGAITASGDWLDYTGLKASVWNCADETSDPTERIISGSASDTDVTTLLKCLNEMRQVEVVYQCDTPVTNYFMEYPAVYCKTETTTLDIPTLAEDGTVASTTSTEVVIKWMCDEQADENYHLHPLFQRYTRNAEDDTYTITDLEKGYIARYPISNKSVTYGGETYVVSMSVPDSSKEVGLTRSQFLSRCKAINNIPVTVDGVDYAAGDERRFSMVAWGAEISFLQWVGYLLYGVNIQAAISGVSTSSVASTTNGATDWLFAKGIRFGSADTTDNTKPCLVAGIEDGLHSSTGWMCSDLTFFFRRLEDDTTDKAMLMAIDRADFNPESGDYEALQTAGYTRLEGQVTGSNQLGAWTGAPYRDLMLFATGTTGTDGSIYTGSVDAAWYGTTPASGTVANSARMVALGDYRYYGVSLGAFTLAVYGGLAFSDGTWRSRVSLNLLAS